MSDIASKESRAEPLVVRPCRAKEMLSDCSCDELYRKIKLGELDSYFDGRRRLIRLPRRGIDVADHFRTHAVQKLITDSIAQIISGGAPYRCYRREENRDESIWGANLGAPPSWSMGNATVGLLGWVLVRVNLLWATRRTPAART